MRNFKLIVLLIILLQGFSTSAQISNDSEAKRYLDNASTKYKSYESIVANFKITVTDATFLTLEEYSGTLFLKGSKYKIEAPDVTRICDGQKVWMHFIEEEEVQITDFSAETGEISPSEFFNLDLQDYKYIKLPDSSLGADYVDIDVTPIDKSYVYSKVRLSVNRSTAMIEQAIVFDKNNYRYIYELNNFDTNKRLSDSFFVFDKSKYPDVDIIDLTEE